VPPRILKHNCTARVSRSCCWTRNAQDVSDSAQTIFETRTEQSRAQALQQIKLLIEQIKPNDAVFSSGEEYTGACMFQLLGVRTERAGRNDLRNFPHLFLQRYVHLKVTGQATLRRGMDDICSRMPASTTAPLIFIHRDHIGCLQEGFSQSLMSEVLYI
jgi:hypothetical protein